MAVVDTTPSLTSLSGNSSLSSSYDRRNSHMSRFSSSSVELGLSPQLLLRQESSSNPCLEFSYPPPISAGSDTGAGYLGSISCESSLEHAMAELTQTKPRLLRSSPVPSHNDSGASPPDKPEKDMQKELEKDLEKELERELEKDVEQKMEKEDETMDLTVESAQSEADNYIPATTSPRRRAFRRKSEQPQLYKNVMTLQVPSGDILSETDEYDVSDNDNTARRASYDDCMMTGYLNYHETLEPHGK